MTASHSRDLPDAHSRAEGYEKKRNDLVRRDSNLTDIFSAGAIVSSVKDLVQWARAIDSASIVSRSALQQMWSPVKLNDGSSYPYGFGWRLEDFDGRRNIGHSGSTSGFSASLQRFPDYDLTVIVLCNLGEEGMATSVARMVAEIVTTPRKKAVEAGK
jgi:CubicO group peptidase (beta-lactamase class C family)